MNNEMIHLKATVTPCDWTAVKAVFYVDGHFEDSVVTPREKLKVGTNLFDGVNRAGGWTNYGNAFVESIDGDTIVTSRGTLTPTRDVSIDIPNVMPYADGEIHISLYSEYTTLQFPAPDGKGTISGVIPTGLYNRLMAGSVDAYEQFAQALAALFPSYPQLAAPYEEYVKKVREATDWRYFAIDAECEGVEALPHFRVRAVFGRDTVYQETHKPYSDDDQEQLSWLKPRGGSRYWDLYVIENGQERLVEHVDDATLKVLDGNLPVIWAASYSSLVKKLRIEVTSLGDGAYISERMTLYTGLPQALEASSNGITLKMNLSLLTKAPEGKTVPAKIIADLMAATKTEQMSELYFYLKYCHGVDNEMEIAQFAVSKRGQAKLAEFKAKGGHDKLNGIKMLDSLRTGPYSFAPAAAEAYARCLQAEGKKDEAAKAFNWAAKQYQECGDDAAAARMISLANS